MAATPQPSDLRSESLLIAIATYNEIDNLPRLVEAIRQYVPQVNLLIIDDNSPDGTGRWVDETRQDDPRLHVIHRSGKLGLGSATVCGMEWAIKQGYPWLATMDADFSHAPEHLPDLIEALRVDESRDVAIGSRYVPGGQISGWPWTRRWMSRWVNRYARLMLGLPVRDCSGAFRIYRVQKLRELPPDSIECQGYAYLEEILWRLKKRNTNFCEVPIHFRDRTAGQTKINSKEAVDALFQLMRFGFQNWFGR